jgi:leucyl aminopeptidase (aminopeptidase T)
LSVSSGAHAPPEDAIDGADLLLSRCGYLRAGEQVVVVCDTTTRDLGELLASRARRMTDRVELHEIAPMALHGQEPPQAVAERMLLADLCIGITARSLAHTRARQAAAANGARYLSLPDYSVKLLRDPSLRADYVARGAIARRIAKLLTGASRIHVTSAAGTDITMSAAGRLGNSCPGYVKDPGSLGSPPDIEANVSPIETSAEGLVVVDGSIPYPTLGLLRRAIRLRVRGGRTVDIAGDDDGIVSELRQVMESACSSKAYVLAECGIGLNDRATLTGVMLTDEGAAGTMHFGFGSNSTVGGTNEVAFHLDFVFRSPSLSVDGREVLRAGEFVMGPDR